MNLRTMETPAVGKDSSLKVLWKALASVRRYRLPITPSKTMKFCFHKYGILLFGGLCCVFSSLCAGEIPSGFPVERYSSLWEHSPFTIASIQQEASPAGFAQNLAVVGVAKIGDKDMVTLLNKQSLERVTVTSDSSNAQGMKIVSVAADTDPLKTSVTIQKGSEVAKVGFDKTMIDKANATPQNMTSAPMQPIPVAGQPPNPNMPPIPARQVRRMPAIPVINSAPPPAGNTPPLPH